MVNGSQTQRIATIRALEAQRLLDLIGLKVMPALAAGAISYVHMRDVGYAALIAAAMLIALQPVERPPLARVPTASSASADWTRPAGRGSRGGSSSSSSREARTSAVRATPGGGATSARWSPTRASTCQCG